MNSIQTPATLPPSVQYVLLRKATAERNAQLPDITETQRLYWSTVAGNINPSIYPTLRRYL